MTCSRPSADVCGHVHVSTRRIAQFPLPYAYRLARFSEMRAGVKDFRALYEGDTHTIVPVPRRRAPFHQDMVVQREPYNRNNTSGETRVAREGTAVKLTSIMRHPYLYNVVKPKRFTPEAFLKTKEFTKLGKIRTLSVIRCRRLYVAEANANRKEHQAKQQQEEEGIDGKEDSIAAVL
eukprot:GHVU01099792.1.p1 GENE.GHVU01099792.1~~GHVU01099792.1.p1  ORF type:complete len:178 (-),score=11.85 GHVU01099792.1:19-552(-)